MSLIWIIAGFITLVISGSVGGFISRMLLDGIGYAKLDNRINALQNKINSGLGVTAKAEQKQLKDERMAQASADFMALKEEGKTNAEIMALLAPKYIDIAPDILKMFGVKGGIQGLLSM
mgnify:FL=1